MAILEAKLYIPQSHWKSFEGFITHLDTFIEEVLNAEENLYRYNCLNRSVSKRSEEIRTLEDEYDKLCIILQSELEN